MKTRSGRMLRRMAALMMCFSLLPGAACMAEGTPGAAADPEEEMKEGIQDMLTPLNISLAESYKKIGENNPLYTQRFGADPGVMEYGGRLYVYMTDDIIERDSTGKVKENTYGNIRFINCISSDDLVNWTDHGRIPVAGAGGIAAAWAKNSWAPCAAHKTIGGEEKFFLYFCNGGNGIGVLTADSPTGPWRDEVGGLLISRQTPNCADVTWLFDPAVMVDEDGTGYLAFGGGVPEGRQAAPGTGRIVRLGADMMSLDGDPVALDVPWLFEDSGLNRIGDTYIYSYCSNWQTEGNSLGLSSGAICYMTADHPMGPYTYAGELFPNEGKFFGLYGNNHHSIACLNGQYYLFYHNRPVEKAMGITGNYRSPQVDVIPIDADGTIHSVTGTMRGVPQLKSLRPDGEVSAATMANQANVAVAMRDGNTWVHGRAGGWTMVAGVDFGSGVSRLTVRCAGASGGTLYAVAGSLDAPVAARIVIPQGTAQPAEFTADVSLSGVQDLYFVFDGEMDFHAWRVE